MKYINLYCFPSYVDEISRTDIRDKVGFSGASRLSFVSEWNVPHRINRWWNSPIIGIQSCRNVATLCATWFVRAGRLRFDPGLGRGIKYIFLKLRNADTRGCFFVHPGFGVRCVRGWVRERHLIFIDEWIGIPDKHVESWILNVHCCTVT